MTASLQRLLESKIDWEPTQVSEFVFQCKFEDRVVLLRLNDFPAEPLCTVVIDDTETDLIDFPTGWRLPRHREQSD